MDLVEQVHTFGLSNIHTFGPNISLIRLFSLIFYNAKPRMCLLQSVNCQFTNFVNLEKSLID